MNPAILLRGVIARQRAHRPATLVVAAALFIVGFDNGRLFLESAALGADGWILASLAAAIGAVLVAALTPLAWPYLTKPLLAVVLIASAGIGHFMDTYGVVIDAGMVRNILQTDAAETRELLSAGLLLRVLALGVVPAAVIACARVRYGGVRREVLGRALLVAAALGGASLMIYANFRELAIFTQENRHLRYFNNPLYPVSAFVQFGPRALGFAPDASRPKRVLGEVRARSAVAGSAARPRTVVLVVGETARARNFSLNGYARPTNRYTSQRDVTSYTQVSSCSTSTATAIPCMFSFLGRSRFSVERARRQENLLELAQRAGVAVAWRENNSGCKGVCEGVATRRFDGEDRPEACVDGQCFDEVLLQGLEQHLGEQPGDTLIVLHLRGSHGPAYFRRHPAAFTEFRPECQDERVELCSTPSIVNAYDNTILYTDYFLDRTVDLLERLSARRDTAMLYLSDHGESLGEGGVFLHGLPYSMAPAEQKHVPMILWLSEGFRDALQVQGACVSAGRQRPLSHDNLSHTILGLLDLSTPVYDRALDVLSSCRDDMRVAARLPQGP